MGAILINIEMWSQALVSTTETLFVVNLLTQIQTVKIEWETSCSFLYLEKICKSAGFDDKWMNLFPSRDQLPEKDDLKISPDEESFIIHLYVKSIHWLIKINHYQLSNHLYSAVFLFHQVYQYVSHHCQHNIIQNQTIAAKYQDIYYSCNNTTFSPGCP